MGSSKTTQYRDRTVDIFGSKWKLKFVDAIEVDDGASVDGLTDSTNRIISVDVKQAKNEADITLLHELIHAILNTGQYFNASSNEPMVEFLARGIQSLIKQGVLQWKL